MKNILLSLLSILFSVTAFAGNDSECQEIPIKDEDPHTHSEIPVDVDTDSRQIRIYFYEAVDCATVDIYGTDALTVLDIGPVASGEVYQIDMTQFPSGCYDIYINADGKVLYGDFELYGSIIMHLNN